MSRLLYNTLKVKLMKLQVSKDTNVELSSEDEKNSRIEEEKQDSSNCFEDLEAPTTSEIELDRYISITHNRGPIVGQSEQLAIDDNQ